MFMLNNMEPNVFIRSKITIDILNLFPLIKIYIVVKMRFPDVKRLVPY